MHQDSIATQIMTRMKNNSRDRVYTATDFSDLGDYNAVRQSLLRLGNSGDIQKIMRGVYYYPRYSDLIQEYEAPAPGKVAEAIARKYNWTISPAGDTALNMLGLSTQVPANWCYVSNGPYHQFQLGKFSVEFKHRNNREMSGMSPITSIVIQALKAIGEPNINDTQLALLRRKLSDDEKATVLKETQQSSTWIHNTVKQICS